MQERRLEHYEAKYELQQEESQLPDAKWEHPTLLWILLCLPCCSGGMWLRCLCSRQCRRWIISMKRPWSCIAIPILKTVGKTYLRNLPCKKQQLTTLTPQSRMTQTPWRLCFLLLQWIADHTDTIVDVTVLSPSPFGERARM